MQVKFNEYFHLDENREVVKIQENIIHLPSKNEIYIDPLRRISGVRTKYVQAQILAREDLHDIVNVTVKRHFQSVVDNSSPSQMLQRRPRLKRSEDSIPNGIRFRSRLRIRLEVNIQTMVETVLNAEKNLYAQSHYRLR